MKKIITDNLSFLVPFLLFAVIGLLSSWTFNKAELHLIINQYHHPIFDFFFAWITHLGDGLTALLAGLIFLTLQIKKGLFLLSASLTSGLFTQALKKIIFYDCHRPLHLLGEEQLHLVSHVKVHMHYSFPSGHTTTAFALFLALAVMTKNTSIKILLFILAALVGYSRIYLSQHFTIDVVAGSSIGVIFTLLCAKIYLLPHQWLRHSPYHSLIEKRNTKKSSNAKNKT